MDLFPAKSLFLSIFNWKWLLIRVSRWGDAGFGIVGASGEFDPLKIYQEDAAWSVKLAMFLRPRHILHLGQRMIPKLTSVAHVHTFLLHLPRILHRLLLPLLQRDLTTHHLIRLLRVERSLAGASSRTRSETR